MDLENECVKKKTKAKMKRRREGSLTIFWASYRSFDY